MWNHPCAPEVVLQVRTEGDQRQFRLGDVIPVRFSYSSSVTGRYLFVMEGNKLTGGHGREISCSPAAERNDALPSLNALQRFQEMLLTPCVTFTRELGGFSFCGGCGESPLKAEAITFSGALNTYVLFRTAGRYTCYCSSAEVTTDVRDATTRSALLVKSNPLVLDIVADPAWARSAALSYAEAYDKSCRDPMERQHSLQCSNIADRLMYLDTPESLAAVVKLFDGRNPQWGNGPWLAIIQTSFPRDALRLMTSRVQEPDFHVAAEVLESLAMLELKIEVPDAFESADPLEYHFHSVERLRKYVRLLGDSLSHKRSDVMQGSVNAYRLLAQPSYCESSPLIPIVEQQQTLAAAGIL